MFHPRGPNFFRSWMTAWKKQIPKTSRLHVTPRAGDEIELIHWSKQLQEKMSNQWTETDNPWCIGAATHRTRLRRHFWCQNAMQSAFSTEILDCNQHQNSLRVQSLLTPDENLDKFNYAQCTTYSYTQNASLNPFLCKLSFLVQYVQSQIYYWVEVGIDGTATLWNTEVSLRLCISLRLRRALKHS